MRFRSPNLVPARRYAACGVLALRARQHLAENHLVDLARLGLGPLQHALDHGGAELVRGCRTERSVEGTDRGTARRRDHDIDYMGHGVILVWRSLEREKTAPSPLSTRGGRARQRPGLSLVLRRSVCAARVQQCAAQKDGGCYQKHLS